MAKAIMLESTIPFGGFYESSHSYNLDRALEQVAQDDSGDAVELFDEDGEEFALYDHIDWQKVQLAYAQLYTENFAAYFKGETKIDLQLTFDEMTSPREYNFATDRIFIKIPTSIAQAMYRKADKAKLDKAIKAKFTSYDGFISYYSNSLVEWRSETGDVTKWDANQLGTLIESLLSEFMDDDDRLDWMLMEVSDCNGELSNIVWDALDVDAVRIVNAYNAKRRAHEYFLSHQLTIAFPQAVNNA